MSGYIKLHRTLLDWDWWDDHNTTRLFIYLLLKAKYTDGKWRGRIIKGGQLVTGRNKISESTGLSVQSVRTSLDKLKSTNEITIESTSQYSVITINNWDLYQQDNQQTNKRATSEQPASNHYIRREEGKKKKNIDSDTFKDFLTKFNEVTGKQHRKLSQKASKQLKQRLKDYSLGDILLATKNASLDDYHLETNLKYITPEFITREDKLDKFLNVKPKKRHVPGIGLPAN